MSERKDGRRFCLWCGLAGHRRSACWVMHEGRTEADAADRLAAEIVSRYSTRASDLGAMRGAVAQAVRIAAHTGSVPQRVSPRRTRRAA